MSNSEIVLLEASQIQLASEILGNSFKNDPVFQHFARQDDCSKLNLLRSSSKMILHYAYSHQAIYTTTETIKGVAIWIPPYQFPLNEFRLLMAGGYAIPFKLRLSKLWQFVSLFLKVETFHQTYLSQPHWYLMMLGVDPIYQNQGVGAALIEPILTLADRSNLPCYLETSTAAAVRFYQRQGFEVVANINSSLENICIWVMTREPQKQ